MQSSGVVPLTAERHLWMPATGGGWAWLRNEPPRSSARRGASRPTSTACRPLAAACVRSLPVTGVGLALMTDEGPAGIVAATDGAALLLEELQFTLGEGPCVDASRTGRPVLQPDLARTAPLRWPAFADGALEPPGSAPSSPSRCGSAASGSGCSTSTGTPPARSPPTSSAEALSFADAATLVLLHLQARAAGDGAAAP